MKIATAVFGSLFIILILVNDVFAFNESKDLSMEILLDTFLNVSIKYDKLFLVKNLNDTPGIDDNVKFSIYWFVNNNSAQVINQTFSRSVNYYTSSGMGYIKIESEGNYTLCGNISVINFEDNNLINNFLCHNFFVYDNDSDHSLENYSNIANETVNNSNNSFENDTDNVSTNFTDLEKGTCNCSVNINLDKEIVNDGETLGFYLIDCNDSSNLLYSVDYWIEDLSGNVMKSVMSTFSKSKKSFTPKLDFEKSMYVFANSSCSSLSKKLFVFNKTASEKSHYLDVEFPDFVSERIFFVELKGYKGNTGKTVLSVWVSKKDSKISEVSKVYVNNKYSEFSFRVPVLLDDDFFDDSYELHVEGLDFEEVFEVEINLGEDVDFIVEDVLEVENVNEIVSFYTRKKNFESSINLFSSLNIEDSCVVRVYSDFEIKDFDVHSGLNNFSINISSPKSLIVEELVCADDRVDLNFLLLNLSVSEKIVEIEKIVQTNLKNDSKLTEKNNSFEESITGNVILENDDKPGANWVLISFLSIVGIFVLFGKDIIKNAKLFKAKFNTKRYGRKGSK